MTKPKTTLTLKKSAPAPLPVATLVPVNHPDAEEQFFSEELPRRTRQTNTDMMFELMTFARSGAMMQAFVMTAIEKYAEQCIKAGPRVFDSPMLAGEAWLDAAFEAKEAIKKHFSA